MRRGKKRTEISSIISKEDIKYAIDLMCENEEEFTPIIGLFFWIEGLACGIFFESAMLIIFSVFCIILFLYILFLD